jgi:putative transposase
MEHFPKRKRIRLARDQYRVSDSIVAVTISAEQRQPVFRDADFLNTCIELLRERARELSVAILAYCFMPNHVHLLVRIDAGGDLVEFIRDYKSRTTRCSWEHGFQGKLWQRSFYDHVLREHDDPQKHILYIFENPVRAGIVDSWLDYPWIGSLEFDIYEIQNWES